MEKDKEKGRKTKQEERKRKERKRDGAQRGLQQQMALYTKQPQRLTCPSPH